MKPRQLGITFCCLSLLVVLSTAAQATLVSLFSAGTSNKGDDLFIISDRDRIGMDVFDANFFWFPTDGFSGRSMGTLTNENIDVEKKPAERFGFNFNLPANSMNFSKIDIPDTADTEMQRTEDGDGKSRTRETSGSSHQAVHSNSVKSDQENVLHAVEPAETGDRWSTDFPGSNKISEIPLITVNLPSTRTAPDEPQPSVSQIPVPEPVTLIIFGSGLLALAAGNRFKKAKQ